MTNFLISFWILLSIELVNIIFIWFAFHLGYKEKLEQSLKFYITDSKRKLQEALDDIEQDYKDEVNEKRLYRKHIEKLLQEKEEHLEKIDYMKKQLFYKLTNYKWKQDLKN